MIAQNLALLRQRFRYSQEEVAGRIGVSRQTVAKWENGDSIPDLINCQALAGLYSVTLDQLVNPTGPDASPVPRGKHLFGQVRVGERGQIVIPKRAREIFGIHPGDSLVVLGDESQGLALMKSDDLMGFLSAVLELTGKEESDESN